MTNDVPLATANGSPSAFLNGTAWMSISSTYGERTFGYHCALTCDPTWFGDELVVLAERVERVREALDLREAALRVVDLLQQFDAGDVARVVEGRLALVVGELTALPEHPQICGAGRDRVEAEHGGNAAALLVHLLDRAEMSLSGSEVSMSSGVTPAAFEHVQVHEDRGRLIELRNRPDRAIERDVVDDGLVPLVARA